MRDKSTTGMKPTAFIKLTYILLIIKVKNSDSKNDSITHSNKNPYNISIHTRQDEALQNEIKQLEKEKEECLDKKGECEHILPLLTRNLNRQKFYLEACKDTPDDYTKLARQGVFQARSDLTSCKEDEDKCTEQLKAIETRKLEVEKKLQEKQDERKKLEDEKNDIPNKEKTCEKNLKDEKDKAKKCEDDKKVVDDELDKVKKEFEQEKKENERREKEKNEKEKEAEEVEKKLNATTEKHKKLGQEKLAIRAEIDKLKRELEELRHRKEQHKQGIFPEIDEFKKKITEGKDQLKNCESKLKLKDEEINRLREESKKLKEGGANKQDDTSKVQKDGSINILSPLSDALEIVKTLKLALGRKLHTIIGGFKVRTSKKKKSRN